MPTNISETVNIFIEGEYVYLFSEKAEAPSLKKLFLQLNRERNFLKFAVLTKLKNALPSGQRSSFYLQKVWEALKLLNIFIYPDLPLLHI